MKKNLYIWVTATLTIISGSIFTACEEVDEMPERTESNVTSAYYKVPDPVVLNADETVIINEIKAEYNENVSQ